jgi:hypothetical protein
MEWDDNTWETIDVRDAQNTIRLLAAIGDKK